MDPQIEAVARAICQAEGLDPDARISETDYVGGLRADAHHEMSQWQAKTVEAGKFILMHRALAASSSTHPLAPDGIEPPILSGAL